MRCAERPFLECGFPGWCRSSDVHLKLQLQGRARLVGWFPDRKCHVCRGHDGPLKSLKSFTNMNTEFPAILSSWLRPFLAALQSFEGFFCCSKDYFLKKVYYSPRKKVLFYSNCLIELSKPLLFQSALILLINFYPLRMPFFTHFPLDSTPRRFSPPPQLRSRVFVVVCPHRAPPGAVRARQDHPAQRAHRGQGHQARRVTYLKTLE